MYNTPITLAFDIHYSAKTNTYIITYNIISWEIIG